MKQDKIRIIIDEIFKIVIIHVAYFVELIQRIRYKQKPNLQRIWCASVLNKNI